MIKCDLSCFKQLPLNVTYILLPACSSVGESLLSVGLITLSDNPLDFYSEIFSVLPIFLKYLYISRKTK